MPIPTPAASAISARSAVEMRRGGGGGGGAAAVEVERDCERVGGEFDRPVRQHCADHAQAVRADRDTDDERVGGDPGGQAQLDAHADSAQDRSGSGPVGCAGGDLCDQQHAEDAEQRDEVVLEDQHRDVRAGGHTGEPVAKPPAGLARERDAGHRRDQRHRGDQCRRDQPGGRDDSPAAGKPEVGPPGWLAGDRSRLGRGRGHGRLSAPRIACNGTCATSIAVAAPAVARSGRSGTRISVARRSWATRLSWVMGAFR